MRHAACVIVGGGPAGLSTALFLAHAAPALIGDIVVLERATYPRDKFCAGAVGARADRLLASIGVTVDVPSVPIDSLLLRTSVGEVTVREPFAGRVVRRLEFDAALAETVRARGIRIVEGATVGAVRLLPREVHLDVSTGALSASVVVGADGVGSVVRRAVGEARAPTLAQAIEVDTEPHSSDPPRGTLAFDVSRGDVPGYYWDFPTRVDGTELVCRGVYALKAARGRKQPDIEEVLEDALRLRGLALGNFRKKRYAERGFHRGLTASRGRALLVGEALGIDPVSGEGIAQAIQYGAAAGRYLAARLGGGDVDLSDWPAAIRGASIGRDLITRSSVLGLAYGPGRPRVERFLVDTPEFVRIGLQHFAGHRISRGAVLRAAVGVGRALASGVLR